MFPPALWRLAISDPSLPTTLEEGVRNRSWQLRKEKIAKGEGLLICNLLWFRMYSKMTMDAGAQEKLGERAGGERCGGLRVTRRDRELLAMTAMARYLSSEQIQRLFFSGRTEAACRIRLFQLAGLGKNPPPTRYVRRLRFRSFEGKWFSAWAPTPLGYVVTRSLLGTEPKLPAGDVSASFLEHCVRLNDLFVGLVAAGNTKLPSVRQLPFRWISSDSVRLPWRDYDGRTGTSRARIIQPDATLELPRLQKRYFLECEMGTQPLVSDDPARHGATTNKLRRYSAFMTTYVDSEANRTAYEAVFPDGWPAELVFLLNSPTRRDHLRTLVKEWNEPGTRSLSVQAFTHDEALIHFRSLIATGALPPRTKISDTVSLTRDELLQIEHFFHSATRRLKRARDQAKELKHPQLEVPDYPSNTDHVFKLLRRLSMRFTSEGARQSA